MEQIKQEAEDFFPASCFFVFILERKKEFIGKKENGCLQTYTPMGIMGDREKMKKG